MDLTPILLSHAVDLAAEIDAAAIFVYTEALAASDWNPPEELRKKVILVTRSDRERETWEAQGYRVLRVPRVSLTRMGQVKVAAVLALSRSLLQPGDTIVCLSGLAGGGSLDMILVVEVGREFEMFMAPSDHEGMAPDIHPEVLARVVDLAIDLGAEGREGQAVGALFVIGDTQTVLPLTRQLILNPFRGYPEEERNVLDPALEETIKELATVDGAFLVRGDGVIESAGTYLKTSHFPDDKELPRGLGARHQAAAGITFVTRAVAVTVSHSTGTVTIFRNGGIVTEIVKARPSPRGGSGE